MSLPGLDTVSTRLQRIATLAQEDPQRAFTSLAHHVDLDLLHEAWRRTRKDKAPGVDRVTAEEYAANLEANLTGLLERFKSGSYRAPPVRRSHVPKGDGDSTRPIGIPTLEDKVLQRAVVMVLEAIYEQDFLDCSYGFRPGRSAHQALGELQHRLWRMGGGFIVEVDIQRFFDTLEPVHLRDFLDRRVRDGVIRRSIDKWLKAGVFEEGQVSYPETGTPQGGVISPLLANLYLHEVLDRWFVEEVQPRLEGQSFLIRYADDFVMVFSSERDAHRAMEVLPKRFGRYGLTLHPQKTRLIRFQRPRTSSKGDAGSRPETFDLLGFTHFWVKSMKGKWIVQRKTASSRFSRAAKALREWCRQNRHLPIADQHRVLSQKLRGHYGYYGILGNSRGIGRFYQEATAAWQKWLNRRSQRARMNWGRFKALLKQFPLPTARMPAIPRGVKP